jgi:hypothetical protein
MLKNGGAAGMLAQGILPALGLCAGLCYWFRTADRPRLLPRHAAVGWIWRVALAVLAFPVIHFVFGMMVGPFVAPYYNGGGPLGLVIPPPGVILRTLVIRSAIFLIGSLPAVILWTGSRRGLIGALGLAHAALVGLYGMAQVGSLFPPILRILHGIEITADSFAYAAVLVWLFTDRSAVAGTQNLEHRTQNAESCEKRVQPLRYYRAARVSKRACGEFCS